MKKTVVGVALAFVLSISNVYAATDSYQDSKSFYETMTNIENVEEIFTFGSLEVDSSSVNVEDFLSTEYSSSIAQAILVLTLQGHDPRAYQDVNYVELLENAVQENGAVLLDGETAYANNQNVCVKALYVVGSDKLEVACDYLASMQSANGLYASSWGESVDLTGWVLETLSLVDATRYTTNIENILTYLTNESIDEYGNYYDIDTGWGSYTSANTQACVLMGLLAYDQAGVIAGDYNVGEYNPYDVLLTYQNEDGSFYYDVPGEYNQYATMQGAQAVGHYENGSVYTVAKDKYQTIIQIQEETEEVVPEEETVVPEQTTPDIVDTSDITSLSIPFMGLFLGLAYIAYERKSV